MYVCVCMCVASLAAEKMRRYKAKVCVCVCVCASVCIFEFVHVCVCVRILCMFTCTYNEKFACIKYGECIHTYIHTYVMCILSNITSQTKASCHMPQARAHVNECLPAFGAQMKAKMHTQMSEYEQEMDAKMRQQLEAEKQADIKLVQQLQGQKQGALRYVCMHVRMYGSA